MKKRQSNAGFILIELIIAMAVMGIIAIATYAKSINKYNLQEAQTIGNKIANSVVNWAKNGDPKCSQSSYSILNKAMSCDSNLDSDNLEIKLEIIEKKSPCFLAKIIENRIQERIYEQIKIDNEIFEIIQEEPMNVNNTTFTFSFKKNEPDPDELDLNPPPHNQKCTRDWLKPNRNDKCNFFPSVRVRGKAKNIEQVIYKKSEHDTQYKRIDTVDMRLKNSYNANDHYIYHPEKGKSITINKGDKVYAKICVQGSKSIAIESVRDRVYG